MRGLHALVIFIVAAAIPVESFAQQAIDSAVVAGIVQDATGAAVPAATVTLTNIDRNQTSTRQTDERGRFRFPYQPVGAYKLQVLHPGFEAYSIDLTQIGR